MTPEEKVLDLKIAMMQARAKLLAIELEADSFRVANAAREFAGEAQAYTEKLFSDLSREAKAVANWMDVLRGSI